ncbi:uncharacterized protein LOC131929717 [Physella acuta]|uniref:uncharacterized protein LOC131929717 n=1 Tax=Physella acuta TaxID=109671 RepID=UPI0027DB989D|nr:uncharacterized protein LOC131929717 [Physella acuta]
MPKPDNRVDRLKPTQLSITNSPAGNHFPGKNYLRGVEIQGDFLKVAKSGLYFVYSTTNLKPRPASSDEGTHYKMSRFTIQLMGPEDTSMPLFSSSNTPCEFCSGYFIGGVIRLTAGDRIYVTVSGIELENLDYSSSYLGLVLLTDEAS